MFIFFFRLLSKLYFLEIIIYIFRDPNRWNDDYLREVRWRPIYNNRMNYLEIGKELVMKENLNANRYAIWERIFPINYRRVPFFVLRTNSTIVITN